MIHIHLCVITHSGENCIGNRQCYPTLYYYWINTTITIFRLCWNIIKLMVLLPGWKSNICCESIRAHVCSGFSHTPNTYTYIYISINWLREHMREKRLKSRIEIMRFWNLILMSLPSVNDTHICLIQLKCSTVHYLWLLIIILLTFLRSHRAPILRFSHHQSDSMNKSFAIVSATVWNSLPASIRLNTTHFQQKMQQ